ncbi:calcium-dependent protein kinase 21 [Lysobacteraceae bacterium NML95-0200]|nr:calcium-dependent protein kinase 21 [Xanthomonadaceae bacterium NML95-0200]
MPLLHANFILCCAILFSAPVLAQSSVSDYLQRIDRDGDGRVSLGEYQDWMRYGFDAMDKNRNGVLEPGELPGGRGNAIPLAEHLASLEAGFKRQDRNRDGFLDARELAAPPQRPRARR